MMTDLKLLVYLWEAFFFSSWIPNCLAPALSSDSWSHDSPGRVAEVAAWPSAPQRD